MSDTLIDHERRITRMEDQNSVNIGNLMEKVKLIDPQARQIEALTTMVRELSKRVDAAEKSASASSDDGMKLASKGKGE